MFRSRGRGGRGSGQLPLLGSSSLCRTHGEGGSSFPIRDTDVHLVSRPPKFQLAWRLRKMDWSLEVSL
jgi:hypothetical protein